jgi:AraC-like DNA-binding protein
LCTPELLNIREADDSCTVTVEWLYATDVEPAISVDITFATLIELGRRGSGRPIAPRRVEFSRAGPKSAYYRTYFGVSVQYGGKRNALVLDRSDLDRPFSGHNPEMLDILTPALGAALQELDAQPTTGEQVRAVLKRSLPSGRPDITDVARDLGMSERTLQRRITEEGTSFRDLLADARQDLARSLLSDQSAQMDEVAYLLGYQDTSSFYRAFRDWEGMSPTRWREQSGSRRGALS